MTKRAAAVDLHTGANTARDALHRYRVGSVAFDEARFEWQVGGRLVEVRQKPLQLLALLLASTGEAAGRTGRRQRAGHRDGAAPKRPLRGPPHRTRPGELDAFATLRFNAHGGEGMGLHCGGPVSSGETVLSSARAGARKTLTDDTRQIQPVRHALADCLLNLHRAGKAGSRSQGSAAPALPLARQEANSPARLDCQQGRQTLARGDKAEAQRRLQRAPAGLALTGRVRAALAGELLRELQ